MRIGSINPVNAGCRFLVDVSPTRKQEVQGQETVQVLKPVAFVLCRFVGYSPQ
jgi:hypothetical protein